jgi:hypothetical protein
MNQQPAAARIFSLMVKKEIARADCTPSVTPTSETASPSPGIPIGQQHYCTVADRLDNGGFEIVTEPAM